MKDYAHLSSYGKGLEPIIRFSIPDFGVYTNEHFLNIDEQVIHARIRHILGI